MKFLKSNFFFYLSSSLFLIALTLFFYHDFVKVGYLFHDYNFFRDYPNFLSPTGGTRWQPLMYYANFLAVKVFHFQPFWPKTIVFFFFCLNLILGLWFLVLITKNKFFSLLTVALFAVYFRSSAIVFVYAEGCLDAVYPAFLLLGLISYYYHFLTHKKIFYILTIICYILANLIMEAAIVFPAILFVMDLFLNNQFKIKTALKRMIPFILLLFVYAYIQISTASKRGADNPFQRGEHHLASFPDFLVRISHLLAAHFPARNFYDINLIPLSHDPIDLLKYFLGPVLILTIIFLFLKVPNYLKFFLVTIWLLILPFASFEPSTWGFADRYVYFSGLFFIALFIMTLKLFISNKFKITYLIYFFIIVIFAHQNIILLEMRVNQWKTAGWLVKNVGRELLSKYPVLPSSPVFIIGIPDGLYNAGHPGNFVYFLYNENWPEYLSFHSTAEQAAERYVCIQDSFPDSPPHGIIYEQDTFKNIDLVTVVKQLNLSKANLNCDQ